MSGPDGFKLNPQAVAAYIDHTILRADAVDDDILRLCDEAVRYGFASVCVNPAFVPLAAERLAGSGVKVCTVAGFPLGAANGLTKVYEAKTAAACGAEEIDMVIWAGALKKGKYYIVENEIRDVVSGVLEVNGSALVKVIIETCFLTDEEKVKACQLAEKAGAHYVKTSTGFGPGGAALDDVVLMRKTVGPAMGVKASGGIRTAAQVLQFIEAGAGRIGTSSGVAIIRELFP